MARWHGKTGQVSLGGSVIGSVRGWTLQSQPQLDETTSFGDVNMTYVTGFNDIRGTIEVAWDDAVGGLSAAMTATTPPTLTLTPAVGASGKSASGPAVIGLQNFQVRSTAHVQGTYSFAATGTWTINL